VSNKLPVKSILVSQPQPKQENSPFYDLASKQDVKIDFRSFIHVEGVDASEVRKSKINLESFSAIILTSKNAVDHFFRICKEMRYEVPSSTKYFCISEAVALYLQKYVVYRKRKIYFGKHTFRDLIDVLAKNKEEKYLLPSSDLLKPVIPQLLDKNGIDYTRGIFYRTVCSDLSDLENVYYDILVFYSPSGIKSLFQNFPDFKQNKTRIATFGKTTANAAKDFDLDINIEVPSPETPSMTMALEKYIKEANK
jgi:uroporphyrinogen-III synthase